MSHGSAPVPGISPDQSNSYGRVRAGRSRSPCAVAVTASLESAASYGIQDTLTSAHATKVQAGVYNVAAWVWEPNKKAATLVDRAITITSSVTVTFDARPGNPLRFTVISGGGSPRPDPERGMT
jgi:hypothetical protein